MKFADVPGYEGIKSSLVQAATSGRVAHAQLFAAGDGGFGMMMALAWAQFLNCENPQENDSCGTCFSCVKSSRFIHPDYHYLFPIAKSKKLDSDELLPHLPGFRSFLSEQAWGGLHEWSAFSGFENKTPLINVGAVRSSMQQLYFKAFEARYKIQFIWLPECMNIASSNALLKILEEPPPFTVFLVVSHQPDNLLATLLSRMQRVNIPAPSPDEMIAFLQKRFPEDAADLAKAVSLADGSISRALFLQEEKPDDYHSWYMDWQRACYRKDHGQLMKLSESFHEMGKELQKSVLQYSINKTRNALMLGNGIEEILYLQEEDKRELPNLGKILHAGMVQQMLEHIDRAWYHIDRNASGRMVFFDLSMALADAYRIKTA